ncbi:MAG: twin-arginine translocase TatA/TatE family subunit [Desulfobacteraceae bacterium]|nr:twin-arginine translocase TatA/TatE family subunit [Desulfobacteraceae bacterium]
MFGLGTTELIVIGAIIFLIFGAKRIPEIGKGLGGAIREFRQIKKEVSPEDSTNQTEGNKESKVQKDPPALENKLTQKVVEQIPGVKKAVDLKKKVDKVKEIIK